MLPRFPAVTRSLSLAALLAAGPAVALELPLPPPGEDVVGQVQTIKAKYEDTFADIGTANDLGYLEMIAANPGVDPWLPGAGTEIVLPTRYVLPPGPREGVVINLAEYRLYYYPKGQNVVYTFPWVLAVKVGALRSPTRRSPPRPRTRPGRRQRRSVPSMPPMAISCRRSCRQAPTIRWARSSSPWACRAT